MVGFIREPCIATFRFIALYVEAGRRSIYQNGTCSIRSEWLRNIRKLRSREQMDGVPQKEKRGWKNHNGRRLRMLRRSLPIVRRLVKNAH